MRDSQPPLPRSLPLLIGIAGGTGSGKTTVAERLVAALPASAAVLVQHDWYYRDRSHLSKAERDAVNFDEPAALENDVLVKDLLALKSGQGVDCPSYDFSRHARRPEPRHVAPHPIVICEGILLFAVPSVRDAFDLRLFVDTPDDIRLLRRIRRDLEERGRDIASVDAQYRATVRPMHLLHVEPSRAHAHLIIPEGGDNTHALDVVVGRLLHLLERELG
ncbi:MAG TPA: uridine kinase [Polyangiaceae bacterium]|nr:uridine kinase [Polyangiaceae bacterium]